MGFTFVDKVLFANAHGNHGNVIFVWNALDVIRTRTMGPLQLVSHVVQKHLAGEQETHWDKTNKESYHFKLCKLFVSLVPVLFLLSSKGVFATRD